MSLSQQSIDKSEDGLLAFKSGECYGFHKRIGRREDYYGMIALDRIMEVVYVEKTLKAIASQMGGYY